MALPASFFEYTLKRKVIEAISIDMVKLFVDRSLSHTDHKVKASSMDSFKMLSTV